MFEVIWLCSICGKPTRFYETVREGVKLDVKFFCSIIFCIWTVWATLFSYCGACAGVSFIKDAGLQPATFVNKRLRQGPAFIGKYRTEKFTKSFPGDIYLMQVNNGNTRTMCETSNRKTLNSSFFYAVCNFKWNISNKRYIISFS